MSHITYEESKGLATKTILVLAVITVGEDLFASHTFVGLGCDCLPR